MVFLILSRRGAEGSTRRHGSRESQKGPNHDCLRLVRGCFIMAAEVNLKRDNRLRDAHI